MIMSNGSKLRNSFLATISMGIAVLTVYSTTDPHVGNRRVADFVFPEQISLATWQQLSSESLPISSKPDENGESIESAKRYLYRKDDLSLALEMRYLVGARGNIANLLKEHVNLTPRIMATQQVKKIPGIGSYLLVEEPNSNSEKAQTTYVSSCLTSGGESIATHKEFSAVLNQVELTPRLFWDWLWGKDSIRDRRCLWVNIALSSQDGELDHNDENLAQVWLELHQWWQPRFPQL